MQTHILHIGNIPFKTSDEARHLASLITLTTDHQVQGEDTALPVLVVSTPLWATTLLETMIKQASRHTKKYWRASLAVFRKRYGTLIDASQDAEPGVDRQIEEICTQIEHELNTFPQQREQAMFAAWRIQCWGERLTVMIVAAALRGQGFPAVAVEQALVQIYQEGLLTLPDTRYDPTRYQQRETEEHVWIDIPIETLIIPPKTQRLIQGVLTPLLREQQVPVVSGSWGQDHTERSVHFDHKDSCYVAALIAESLQATTLHLVAENTGVFAADRRVIPDAPLVPFLSYEEAWSLAMLGKVPFRPVTLLPLTRQRIQLHLQSPSHSPAPETWIGSAAHRPNVEPFPLFIIQHKQVRILSKRLRQPADDQWPFLLASMLDLPLPNEREASFLEVSGLALSFLIPAAACETWLLWFFRENRWHLEIQRGLAVCAYLHAGLSNAPLEIASAFSTLATAGISVLTSRVNEEGMFFVIAEQDSERALRVLYRDCEERSSYCSLLRIGEKSAVQQ